MNLHAVELLRDTISKADHPMTLIALAPLTNIALLLRTYPEVASNLEQVMIMGGSASVGNATPVAEFNIWHDPEAAAIVFAADIPITMYGLDVFYQVTVDPASTERLAAHEEPGARMAGQLLRHQIAFSGADPRVSGDGVLGDAGAVCAVADPTGLQVEPLPVQVELVPGFSRGQTLVDRRGIPGENELHGLATSTRRVDVALGVDAARYRQLFLDTVVGGRR